ncbi:hypothetical protein F3N42_09480 [Marinihelvus fidelis]|uniref:Uncharacterized protein n=1 Tax=Marinihelvus fidelis TaxID=2613842 RepID=A0A5N0TA29_9GAMM|nr:hypothetical protein [Marinihelvus fidelis]KAA9131538.1 hypothetical protein F3N42_09480 [Marinihelvus fidelis]
MGLFEELKRRNVIRVGIAYAVMAWLLMQIADVLIDNLDAPDWVFSTLLIALGIGFPLVLVFAWAFELTPEGVKRERDVDRQQSITHNTGRRLNRVIMATLVLAVGYLLVDKFILTDTAPAQQVADNMAESADTRAPSEPAGNAVSVAVLPFVNMSANAENEYFSDGLTDTLLHMLAQLPELRVAARTSSFAFKNQNKPVQEIAAALGVGNILEGSVQRADNQVRVTAQLIRASDGIHLWSGNYTRPLEGIFAIQDEIATDVASALDVALLGGDQAPRHPETESVDAYDLYLQGLEQRDISSFASLGQAESLFKQAISMDPGFIDAKLALAVTYLMQHNTGMVTREEFEPAAFSLVSQVKEQEPDNRLARAVELSLIFTEERSYNTETDELEAAAAELAGLLALLPQQSFLRGQLAVGVAYGLQRFQQGLDIIEAGLILDPLSAELYAQKGNILRGMERNEDANAAFQRALELEPDNPNHYSRMARSAMVQGDLRGGFAWRLRHVQLDPEDHEVVATLARQFYEWDLLEEGDLWAERVRALAPNSDFVQRLRIDRALAAGDTDAIINIAEGMIRQPATMRHGVYPTALFEWLQAMSMSGRSEGALPLLQEAFPGLDDLSTPQPSPQGVMAQYAWVELLARTRPREEALAAWEQYRQTRSAFGMEWADDPYIRMFDALLRNDLQRATDQALEDLAAPIHEWPRRTYAYSDPFLAAVTSDPRVTARIAELDREYAQGQAVIRELVESEAWDP